MDRDSLKTLAPYFMDRIYQELRELILEAEEDQEKIPVKRPSPCCANGLKPTPKPCCKERGWGNTTEP